MHRVASLALICLFVAGCQASPAATPIIVYVTPVPTPIIIYVTPVPVPTATYGPAPTVLATATPDTALHETPPPAASFSVQDELVQVGSLGLTLEELTDSWNESDAGDFLPIRQNRWDVKVLAGGETVSQYYFSGSDDTADNFAFVVSGNDDGSLRGINLLYVPGTNDLDQAMEKLMALFGQSAVIEAVLPDASLDVQNAVLERITPPVGEGYSGVDNTTTEGGVLFHLSDEGSDGIAFVAREDNL